MNFKKLKTKVHPFGELFVVVFSFNLLFHSIPWKVDTVKKKTTTPN